MADLVVTRVGADSLDELEPLWKALHAHHASVAPRLAGRGTRSADEGWRLRRQTYEDWLSQPDPFCLLARLDERPVGYAMVTLGGGLRSWKVGEHIADVQTLSVLPEAKANGVGTRLMDAVEEELRHRGIKELRLLVLSGNDAATRFYERRGMAVISDVMLGNLDGDP
jgi:ribosomal protein S18 acetylase RimI-like enzyme